MSWADRTFPCPVHGEQHIRGMGATSVTLACGAVGSDGSYEHDPVTDAMECFRTAGERGAIGPENHCCVTEVEGRYYWVVQVSGESMTVGGTTIPLHTVITPCDEHLPQFQALEEE